MNRALRSPPRPRPEAPAEASQSRQPRLIGREIRGLRKARGLTLTGLAETSGLSIGHLSLLERDRATPSIKALHAVSRALGVTISWFFQANDVPEEERDLVVRRARHRRLDYSAGLVDELLSPNITGAFELLYCRFPPGASSGDEPLRISAMRRGGRSHRGEGACAA
jgi:transcriptional regulator with XRE-family HTH domain